MRSSTTSPRHELLTRAYDHFNARRIDDALALMVPDVEWPDVAGGRVLHGHDEIRAYWLAQFAVASPHVEPLAFIDSDDGDVLVSVNQRVDGHDGSPLVAEHVVHHRYSFTSDGLVRRMVVVAPD